jgi:hypothetical protein
MKTRETILPSILVLLMVFLIIMSQVIPTAYAQSRPNTTWFSAMAMGTLAQKEGEAKEQKAAMDKEVKTVIVLSSDTDGKENAKNHEEKDPKAQ